MGDRTASPDGDLHSEGDVLIQQNTKNEGSVAATKQPTIRPVRQMRVGDS